MLFLFFSKSIFHKGIWKQFAKKDTTLPASLKPKKSDFGSFVFFDEPTHHIPKTPPVQPPQAEKQEMQVAQAPKQAKISPLQPSQEQKKQAAIVKKMAEASQQKFVKQEKVPQDRHSPIASPAQKASKKISERIKELEKQQAQLAKLPDKVIEEDIINDIIKPRKQRQIRQKKKPKKNIIAMTKGFIENYKDKGNDWLERKGDDNKRPDFKELKYLSYEQRINWQLQAAWKRYHAHNRLLRIPEGKAVIDFSIDTKGGLVHAELLQSSGHRELDDLIMQNITQAAPFPPLPKHFNTDVYKTGRIIHVYARRFGF